MSSEPDHERPPVFGTWRGWYIFLIAVLVAQIAIYYWLTLRFA